MDLNNQKEPEILVEQHYHRRHDDPPDTETFLTFKNVNYFIVGAIVILVTGAIIYTERETKQDDRIKDLEARVTRCEFQIGGDIDSIKNYQKSILHKIDLLKQTTKMVPVKAFSTKVIQPTVEPTNQQ
jgi:hypothetical protein